MEETDRLVALAEELLVLARSRPSHLPLQREKVSLRRFLEDSAAPFRSPAAAAPARITVDGPDEPVQVDSMRLRQAVHNLLDNALRYGEGTPVVVTGERRDGAVAITVADGGPGFPAQVLQRAFEPFIRASANGAGTPKHGAGLGLAIVRAVAEAHGGHAEASNPSSGGAGGSRHPGLTLPAVRAKRPVSGVRPTSPEGPKRSCRACCRRGTRSAT